MQRRHTLLLVDERLIDVLDDPHSKLAQPAWQLFMLRNVCKLQFQNELVELVDWMLLLGMATKLVNSSQDSLKITKHYAYVNVFCERNVFGIAYVRADFWYF